MTKSEYYDANKHQSLNADFIDFNEIQIQKDELNPESKLIKSEGYETLSGESKEVIDLILHTPSEILGLITTPQGEKNKKLIIKYLERRWKSKLLVKFVIDEITELVKLF